MRNITDIYQEYNIMPNLALHQFRVAGVAMQICESLDMPIDIDAVVTACLLHDMGNIIKFDLNYTKQAFPEFFDAYGYEYWKTVQDEYIAKYGTDEHEATLSIIKELGMNEEIEHSVTAVGFSRWCNTSANGTMVQKICAYADTRVNPLGVVSIEERIADGIKRYAGKHPDLDNKRDGLYNCIRNAEQQIFYHCKIKPEDITEDSITSYIEKLKNFTL